MIGLFKLLRAIHPLTPDLRDALENRLIEKRLAKKDLLVKAGHACRNIYFVDKGILRRYYINGDRDITSAFAKENEFCFCPVSFFSQQPGIENIQALEDSLVYSITFDDYARFCKDFPEFNIICRVLLERCYAAKEQVWMAFWMQQAHVKYGWLMNHSTELLQRVSAKQLASYLGITESMFSLAKGRLK